MDMTDEQARIGCWLGIVHRVGSNMTYWVLIEAGHAIARSTVQHITVTDMATNAIKMHVHTFDTSLLTRLDDANFTNDLPNHVFFLQDNDLTDPTAADPIPLDVEYGDMLQPDRPEADEVAFELLISTSERNSLLVNQNGDSMLAKVTQRESMGQ